jgi:hypothetical protein
MKIMTLFLLLVSFVQGYSSELMERICSQAAQIVVQNTSDKEDAELLFKFYSEQIQMLDHETLKQNPELVFRKARASLDMEESSVGDLENAALTLQSDLEFVLQHTKKGSRLFNAANIYAELLNYILLAPDKESIEKAVIVFADDVLRQWAKGSQATGKELRMEVLKNLHQSKALHSSFVDFVITIADPDLALGYITPDEVQVTGVLTDVDGESSLICKIKYQDLFKPGLQTELEIEL